MDLTLTRPQSLQELYKTYFAFANKFQFTALLRNYIQNEEWKDKSQEKVWSLISRISDDLGAVFTDDIVNYTRNVVDVNTCKVPQFLEQCKMLSYNLEHIKNSYGFFPKRVQCLVDLFSVNPEYLIGNSSNHILSDQVIKEILVYIKENNGSAFTNQDVVDRLIDDPHGLVDGDNYYNFVVSLFYNTLVEALSAKYSDEDGQPIVFNLLWWEMQNRGIILDNLKGYKSWVDRYISNEIEHPLNDQGLQNTIWGIVQTVKNQKKMSPRFNPFKLADDIYFSGLNPNNRLTQDELDLVGTVLDYHARTKYNYQEQQFSEDQSTQFAYYRELEFCEYVKMVMFVVNNLNSFDLSNLSYDMSTNKFIQYGTGSDNCLKVAQIFNDGEGHLVQTPNGDVALNHKDVVLRVAKFLADYVFHIQHLRENAKTIACKHAMRGTAGLLAHVVNDYLVKELPSVRDNLLQGSDADIRFQWEIQPDKFLNYGNVKVLEYMDDNEYFNIDPVEDVRFTERTNARYWEKLSEIGYDESLGVLTKREIHDLYANVLGIGKLQPDRESSFDDVQDFLVDLFRIGANPVKWNFSDGDFMNPIDYDPLRDAVYDVEGKYGYTKAERMKVQTNTGLRKNQERQFLEYSGQNLEDDAIQGIYDYMNNQLFYWKNTDYSSHVLHPFMYNLKLWNRLDNIIVNGYRDYINNDLVKHMSSKAKFDELVGEFGECRNFWKYNVVDMTGYTTRYEAAVKDEHKDDANKTTSQLTGYDGLFYPDAALEFLQIYADEQSTAAGERFQIPAWFFVNPQDLLDSQKTELLDYFKSHAFIRAIHSVYWQLSSGVPKFSEYEASRFYLDWYSHLNYTRAEYQKIAMQLWYWRDRVKEMIQTEYPIRKYCLDIQGNSLMLVSTFRQDQFDTNRFLIDLSIAQSRAQVEANGNMNTHVPFCEDRLVKPGEMWVRWKSNPIAFPAFDIEWNQKTGDQQFDLNFRKDNNVEMGQLTHANNDCNDNFHVVIEDWLAKYGGKIQWERGGSNRLPVFFDMEQSANVLALASWHTFQRKVDGVVELDELGNPIYETLCGKNPLHIVSIERTSASVLEYNWTKYIQSSDAIFDEEYLKGMLFDAYHYCPANGTLLVPLYRFTCSDSDDQGDIHGQKVDINMWFIPAQMLKDDRFAAQRRIFMDRPSNSPLDLNQLLDAGQNASRFLFDHPVKVCRNTNLVFSPYEDGNGMNKVKCAFLGVYMDRLPGMMDNHSIKSVSFNTGNGATRYEHDSQSPLDLGLVKNGYYRQNDIADIYEGADPDCWPDGDFRKRRYIDQRISRECFNSYDSNDKYVFVLDFQQSVDNEVLFNNSTDLPMAYAYNILSDAGYIPHFAYQSLVKYGDGVDGTAYTWESRYLAGKEHLQFELLGLDDKEIPDAYANMERMVVEDTTDDCKTIVNPAKLMEDIYRVWCETKGVKENPKDKYESYFENEYKGYDNPELEFDEGNEAVWNDTEDFELTLPQLNDPYAYDDPNVFKRLLDEYYITVVRTDKGELANERKYILPPTSISELLFNNDASTNDGYVRCAGLVEYADPTVQDNHYVPEQVVFTGTQNPFSYDKEGNRVYSKAELLQYGNGIRGVDDIYVGFDIRTEDGEEPIRDKQGNIVSSEEVVEGKIVANVQTRPVQHKFIRPIVKFRKSLRPLDSKNPSLVDRLHNEQNTIPAGSIRVILSHKNMDNLAKYHILNTSSNLYFNGSLPKNGLNQFKHSDFKADKTVHLEKTPTGWRSIEKDANGNPVLEFTNEQISGQIPPYSVSIDKGKDAELWYLEQDGIQGDSEYPIEPGRRGTDHFQENGTTYPIPAVGGFKWAHLAKEVPLSYLDYLYIKRGRLSFKVSEESESFTDLMSRLPSFHIDDVLKNKMADLNDVQILKDYSTFVHQSENPEVVRGCGSFNPLLVNSIVRPGVKQMETHRYLLKENQSSDGIFQLDENGRPIEIGGDGEPLRYDDDGNVLNPMPIEVICANDEASSMIELSTGNTAIPLMLQFEDGELDDHLKIYANYVRVEDKHGDFHYDLYFNIQNLFNSPFEYISTVTKQPNVLVIPDSYLHLTGDKYTNKGDHNEVDDGKMKVIKDGGELSIYGQVKTYSDGVLSDAKTIKMFTYRIYNISDDKPKFLIQKTFDITRSSLRNKTERKVEVKFSDVLWTIDENKFEFVDSSLKDDFRILNQDIVVVQPIHINCHWDKDDDNRVRTLSFDIMHDTIDFANVPMLGQYWMQVRTLNCEVMQAEDVGDKVFKKPYYDHWSDSNMKLVVDENTGIPRLTLTFNEDADFNFETIYLKWILPKGCMIMDSIDRMGGYVFSSTPMNIVADCGNAAVVPKIETSIGHIVARVKRPDRMYLGLEHSTTQRMNGYVISNLAEEIHAALLRGERNPTLEGTSEESRLIENG